MELIILILISIVQSIIGVGVLLFGTPVFLLLGYSFFETLVFLLPISIMISVMTILQNPLAEKGNVSMLFLVFFIILGTYFAIEKIQEISMLIISIILITTFLANIFYSDATNIKKISNKNVVFSIIGFLHGVSNQGGAILLWFYNKTYNDKLYIRSSIAKVYGIMAAFQFITLLIIDLEGIIKVFNPFNILIPVISFLLGSLIFKNVSGESYKILTNIFIGIFGISLLIKFIFTW